MTTDTPKKTGPYSLILCDPPWQFNDKCNAGNRGACHKYPVMDVRDIMALPVAALAAENCLLAMWTVGAQPQEALDVVKAWGFEVKTTKGFTWHKTKPSGKEHLGMGTLTRANTEDCLFAVKGKPVRVSASVRQFYSGPVMEHSRKPSVFRERLVQLLGDVPRIELFGRERADGWHSWGNEVDSDITLSQPWDWKEGA
jgi:N6-adenosine-specific RNA methylase IME4